MKPCVSLSRMGPTPYEAVSLSRMGPAPYEALCLLK